MANWRLWCSIFYVLLLGLGSLAADHDILSVIGSRPSLAKLASFLDSHPALIHIAEQGNITILAPTNEAFDTFFAAQTKETNYSSWDQIEALISYHVLHGVHTDGFVGEEPQFLHSCLDGPLYANVSGGQVVEAVLQDGKPVFKGAVNSEARHVPGEKDILFLMGVIHVVDTVLTPPLNIIGSVGAAPLPHFIDLISLAVLNKDMAPYIERATNSKDTTFIIVNDAAASKQAAEVMSSPEEVIRMINYNHIPGLVLYSPELKNGSQFTTAAGVDVTVTLGQDESVWFNDAKVIRKDLLVANGVAHVVNKVLNASRPNVRPHWTELLDKETSSKQSRPSTESLSGAVKIGIIVVAALIAAAGIVTGSVLYRRRRRACQRTPGAAMEPCTAGTIEMAYLPAGRRTVDSWFFGRSSRTTSYHEIGRVSTICHELAEGGRSPSLS